MSTRFGVPLHIIFSNLLLLPFSETFVVAHLIK